MTIYIICYVVWFVVTIALAWDTWRGHVQSKARRARIEASAERLEASGARVDAMADRILRMWPAR